MKRLLFIAPRLPFPPDKGERSRSFHEIAALAEHFRVDVACLSREPGGEQRRHGLATRIANVDRVLVPPLGRIRRSIGVLGSLLTGRSITEGVFPSNGMRQRLAREEPYDLVIGYTAAAVPLALEAPARARVIDLVDSDSAKWSLYAKRSFGPRRWLWRREAAAIHRLERAAQTEADAVFFISPLEWERSGLVAEPRHVVPNGVDSGYFRPRAGAGTASVPTLVFMGTMSYAPNVDACSWFARDVFSSLRSEIPDLRFLIVGRDPERGVRRLARLPGVEVTGTVDDVRPALDESDLVVVPLRFSFGSPSKILEAMSAGRPILASSEALAGLRLGDLRLGTSETGLIEVPTSDAAAWHRAIVDLLREPERMRHLGAAARKIAAERLSWEERLAPLVELCLQVSSDRRARSTTRS